MTRALMTTWLSVRRLGMAVYAGALFLLACIAIVFYGIARAQSLPAAIDLTFGPIGAINSTTNLALALSVEWPTVGQAYRNSSYYNTAATGTVTIPEYPGYFDPLGCYRYDNANAYFVRIRSATTRTLGSVINPYDCNTGFANTDLTTSGNVLNYGAMSAIDILRYALTGGDRFTDTTGLTVLRRTPLWPNMGFGNSQFDNKTIPAAVVAASTDAITNSANARPTTDVTVTSCNDEVYFHNGSGSCGSTANTFHAFIPVSGTQTVAGFTTTFTGTSTWGGWSSTATAVSWVASGSLSANTPTYAPIGGVAPPAASSTRLSAWTCVDTRVSSDTSTAAIYRNDGSFTSSTNCASQTATGAYLTNNGQVPLANRFRARRNTDFTVFRPVETVLLPGTSRMAYKARVAVCDATEGPNRTDLCTLQPSGSYKPTGVVQQYADRVRLSAFGYLNDDTQGRYGGVMRAPMKFVGNVTVDISGNRTNNPAREWDPVTGVFVQDPLGLASATPSFTRSGVIQYLNRFGALDNSVTQGTYKSFDPVGELYYEVLRYFQGLQPTASAISGLSTSSTGLGTLWDNYMVYRTWTDPIQSLCQNNYALVIGDVNTWNDTFLPNNGYNSSNRSSGAVRTRSAGDPDTTFWTQVISRFETGASMNYTDTVARVQTTNGNLNTNSSNSNLWSNSTGASQSSFGWAGLAYWANTQNIRSGVSLTSTAVTRAFVRTFTVDVDEGGNGQIDGSSRGIAPRNSSFYLAAKYGGAIDTNSDGNFYRRVAQGQSINDNIEWAGGSSNTTTAVASSADVPRAYFLASQARRMIDAIRTIFRETAEASGTITSSGISGQRFASDQLTNALYVPGFDPNAWSGTVRRVTLQLNTATNAVNALDPAVWEAGLLLTGTGTVAASPTPAARKIITYNGVTRLGTDFQWANLPVAAQTALSTDPTTISTTDSLGPQRLNFIRGDRSLEANRTSGTFRIRSSILGDIVNSGVVYKYRPNPGIIDSDYAAFANSVASRTATVYVGANDGMLHAFRASDGAELFAYIPGIVQPRLNRLTRNPYVKTPFVDAIPVVDEARVAGNAWATVLVSGLGGGGQGVFALNVSTPESFSATSVIWEFSDRDDVDMGNVVGQPMIVKLNTAGQSATTPVYRWFAAVPSGVNNWVADGFANTDAAQALFLLALDKAPGEAWTLGTNYFKIRLPAPSGTAATGLSTPNGLIQADDTYSTLYAGDLRGNMWRFDLRGASTTWAGRNVTGGLALPANNAPLFTALSGSTARPITTAPVVTLGPRGGTFVVFGTGRFIAPGDSADTTSQAMYGLWDVVNTSATTNTVSVASLATRSVVITGSTSSVTGPTIIYGTGAGQSLGWVVVMPGAGERVGVDPVFTSGRFLANSLIPDPNSCAASGNSYSYDLNIYDGTGVGRASTVGFLSRPLPIEIQVYGVPTASEVPRSGTGRRLISVSRGNVQSGSGGVGTTNITQTSQVVGGRISWRIVDQQ